MKMSIVRRGFRSSLTYVLGLVLVASAGSVGRGAGPRSGLSPGDAERTAPDAGARECLLLDPGWKFHLGDAASIGGDFNYGRAVLFAKSGEAGGAVDPAFDDSSWRTLDLPHDWAVEQDFVKVDDEDVMAHGYKPIGRQFPKTTIGWYRKSLVIPVADRGKRLAVKFDGVFRDSQVWLNGHYLGRNFSGYSEFLFDVSDVVNFGGKNVLVVRVDAGLSEGWFYEGAGIYRHVWLEKYDSVHIPEYGLFVWTQTGRGEARVHVETQVFNESLGPAEAELRTFVLDDQGRNVGAADVESFRVAADRVAEVEQELAVLNPHLWSLDDPYLYRLVSEVRLSGRVVDRRETEFGVRTLLFDKDKGFFLNGQPVKIQGVCCHQDHAGVGSALPNRLQYYRVERLKEMGCNAYRTSHNPPTPELLQACDRLGLLVMDENRLMGSVPELMGQFERLILRDRNHPSVIIWSLGNEEQTIQDTDVGRRIARALAQRQKELDPSRLCTYAADNGKNYAGINEVVDVRGFNYHLNEIDTYRAQHPDQVLWGSETASTVSTRGVYANDAQRGYVADYDLNFPPWASTAEKWWTLYGTRPWLMGGFVWTGFDYRGEPTPYAWPCINSHFGIMDTCGFPKNNYYYYQAWWTDKAVLHICPHWNWKGREGQTINVWCQSNCDSVELFLNGRSLGRKTMPRFSHLEWKVTYEPGVLSAKGWRKGKVITAKVETTGIPAALRLVPDRTSFKADSEDVVVFNLSALDLRGREVPTADNLVRFEVKGSGRIIGVGNGDPSSHEPDKFLSGGWQRRLFNGKCQVIVQATREPGSLTLTATSDGLKTAAVDVAAKASPLRPRVE
jgi:beta-galactosidase